MTALAPRPARTGHPPHDVTLTPDDAGFRAWASGRRDRLRRTAYLLVLDWHDADDIVQDTLTRMYARWPSIAKGGSPDAYARRVIATRVVDRSRRPWRRERPLADLGPLAEHHHAAVDDAPHLPGDVSREELLAALRRVPVRQRAVLVLRYFDDQSIDQIAGLLAISPGTVKSQASRGLDRLRRELDASVTAAAPADSSDATRPTQGEDLR